MNKVIESLLAQKEKQEDKIKTMKFELRQIDESLFDELNKETNLLNKVLKHSLIEIITMMHKRKLLCFSVKNAETMLDSTKYVVSDGCYFANIIAKDGKIIMDLSGIDNDGGGKKLRQDVKNLIVMDITPFCEKEKMKYASK